MAENKTEDTPEEEAEFDNDDFDDDLDDLDELLKDDVFSSKSTPKSALKETKVPSLSPKKNAYDSKPTIPSNKEIESHLKDAEINKSPQHKLQKQASKLNFDDFDNTLDDFKSDKMIKSSTFISETKQKSPQGGEVKNNGFVSDETKYLDELGFNKLSQVSNNRTDDSLMKEKGLDESDIELPSDEEDDILKTLGIDKKSNEPAKKVAEKKPVQKKNEKLKSEENLSLSKEDDDFGDIAGAYIPTASSSDGVFSPSKGNKFGAKSFDKSPIRRRSLLKQVSFKDLSDINETTTSGNGKEKSVDEKVSTGQKKDSKKQKEVDWLSFFNESPKKQNKPLESNVQKESKGSINKENQEVISDPARRRSSSADWLGLGGSKSLSKSTVLTEDVGSNWSTSNDTLDIQTPAPKSIMRRRDSKTNLKEDFLVEGDTSNMNSPGPRRKQSGKELPDFENKQNKDLAFLSQDVPFNSDSLNLNSNVVSPKHVSIPREPINQSSPEFAVTKSIVPQANSNTDMPVQGQLDPAMYQAYSNANQNALTSLQMMLNNITLEKEQLSKSSEMMKLSYEEKIRILEDTHRDHLTTSKDLLEVQKIKLNEEHGSKLRALEMRMDQLETEKKQLALACQVKIFEIEKDSQREVQKLKDLHKEAISAMKQDHEDALTRLNKLKDQEVEAISSSQVYARSLQHLTDQLEAHASGLATLQAKVEDKNQRAINEKQALLDNKEKDLRALEKRLQKQLDEGDEERVRLQQLVLKLENRLQRSAAEGEEDRWEVQQMKARLAVQQRYLDEEQKIHSQQLEREKEKLRLSQDSLLHEQKTVLLQLAQERQQLTQEKIEIESLAKRIKEEDARLNVKKLKEESSFESQKRLLQQQEDKFYLEKSQFKQESYQLHRDKETVEREKQLLKDEKEKFDEFKLTIKRRAEEVEEMAMSAAADREHGRSAHAAARKIESEHHTRTQQFTQQMQVLMNKERQILLEKEELAKEKQELEARKETMLCHRCKLSATLPLSTMPPVITPMQHVALPILNTNPMDPNLVVWYLTAQKDREFLQEELSFLQSLKDSGKPN